MPEQIPNTLFYTTTKPQGLADGDPVTLSTRLILKAADELGVHWNILPNTKIIELSYQGVTKYFRYQISTETTDVGFYSCLDKSITSALLTNAGISVPQGFHLKTSDSEKYWLEVFAALPKPVVVKPTTGNQGKEITLGVEDEGVYVHAVKKAFLFSNDKESGVIVESQFTGKEYRIIASRKKVIAVAYRMPANVIGDGVQTIADLIAVKNSDPRRFDDPNESLVTIKIDDHVLEYLSDQRLELTSVPEKDKRIFVRRNSNISTGGDSIDVTDKIHPSVGELAIKAVNAVPGLDFAGVDFMTKNIEAEQNSDSYRIIEINSSPGFSIHEFPFEGKARNAGREFIYISFPTLVASI